MPEVDVPRLTPRQRERLFEVVDKGCAWIPYGNGSAPFHALRRLDLVYASMLGGPYSRKLWYAKATDCGVTVAAELRRRQDAKERRR